MVRLTPLELLAKAERLRRGTRSSETIGICDDIANTDWKPPAECPECAEVKAAEAKRKAENAARVAKHRRNKKEK